MFCHGYNPIQSHIYISRYKHSVIIILFESLSVLAAIHTASLSVADSISTGKHIHEVWTKALMSDDFMSEQSILNGYPTKYKCSVSERFPDFKKT